MKNTNFRKRLALSSPKGFTRTPKFGVTPKGGGFTLLELLIVVAIIAILAGVAGVFLTGARREGDEAAVKTNLQSIRSEVGIFYLDNNNTYGEDFASSCPTDFDENSTNMFAKSKTIYDAVTEAVKRGNGSSYCYVSGNSWAVAVGLKADTNTSWCIDGEGASKQINRIPSQSVTNSVCAPYFCVPGPGRQCKPQGGGSLDID